MLKNAILDKIGLFEEHCKIAEAEIELLLAEREETQRIPRQVGVEEYAALAKHVLERQIENDKCVFANAHIREQLARAQSEAVTLTERFNRVEKDRQDALTRLARLEAELQASILKARRDETTLRDRLAVVERERANLVTRCSQAEAARDLHWRQADKFYSQATALAAEADEARNAKIRQMFPVASFLDPTFEPEILYFDDRKILYDAMAKDYNPNFCFVNVPPAMLPVRLINVAQHGYCFYPAVPKPEDAAFQLIIELRHGEWCYFGRYTLAYLPEHEMRLSEWMTLDEQTKIAHCARIAGRDLPSGVSPSYPAQLEFKRRYEIGEGSVPCYSLRCVGFDVEVYHALITTTKRIALAKRLANAG